MKPFQAFHNTHSPLGRANQNITARINHLREEIPPTECLPLEFGNPSGEHKRVQAGDSSEPIYISQDPHRRKIVTVVLLLLGSTIVCVTLLRSCLSQAEELSLPQSQVDVLSIEKTQNIEDTPQDPVISIQGMVEKPGLYTVKHGDRVGNVLEKSYPLLAGASLEGLNLAQPVHDGMQITVAGTGSSVFGEVGTVIAGGENSGNGVLGGSVQNTLININTASATELESVTGVGPKTAQNIVEYRTNHGNFTTVEELQRVKGIGPSKFEAMKDQVTL